MEKCYVVICRYYGCEDCGDDGSHILMVTTVETLANIIAHQHEKADSGDTNHHHGCYVDVEEHIFYKW